MAPQGPAANANMLTSAVILAAAQLAILAVWAPRGIDWYGVTLLQALAPAVGLASLTHQAEAVAPLLVLNVVWAAAVLPVRVSLTSMVWNLGAACIPVVMALHDDQPVMEPGGRAGITAAVMLCAGGMVQLLTHGMRHSQAQSDTESRTDVLTGLFNRRHTDEALAMETRLAARSNRPCAVLMVDVDHFKSVNDTFGHAAGDEVLVSVARRIMARARAGDVACRWGGEEFMLLARDIPDHDALASLAEDVRMSCFGAVRVSDGRVVPVTVSVGASLSSRFPTPDTLTEAADRALYESKRDGRNRCTVAGAARTLGQVSAPAAPRTGR
ncbi:MAG: GGDEF domain-containing protein [Thermoleophilia bacterium]